jgi:protein transport protein SEC61 subunit gamma and related proteins
MSILVNTKQFVAKCARVFKVARKPTKTELQQVSKISALGLLIIGFMGFAISILFTLLWGVI